MSENKGRQENEVIYILSKEYGGNRCRIERRRASDNYLLTAYDAYYSFRRGVGKYTCYPEKGVIHGEFTGKIVLSEREVKYRLQAVR